MSHVAHTHTALVPKKKETYTCGKRPTKETDKRDQQNRPTHESKERNLAKVCVEEVYNRVKSY